MKKLVIAGECMVEISGPRTASNIGFGGDSLNAAIYAARMGGAALDVTYVTRLGDDAHSQHMRAQWNEEGLNTGHVAMVPSRTAGLYAITTDAGGERSFTYWRGESPARELFLGEQTEQELQALAEADMIFVTGITLAILSSTGRSNLLYAMHAACQRGAWVAFDANYRPRLWDSSKAAAKVCVEAYNASNLVFASGAEHRDIFGDESAAAIETRLKTAGVQEWVLRDGTGPITLGGLGTGQVLEVDPVTSPTDTTGAGDSFAGSYLGRRLCGDEPRAAAEAAMAVSARVIQHQGAVIERKAMRDLMP